MNRRGFFGWLCGVAAFCFGTKVSKSSEMVETTTLQNQYYRTYVPIKRLGEITSHRSDGFGSIIECGNIKVTVPNGYDGYGSQMFVDGREINGLKSIVIVLEVGRRPEFHTVIVAMKDELK